MSTLAITDATFADEVLKSDLPVLVDYWADWCAPCRQLAPVVEELSKQYDGRMKFCSMDTNVNRATPAAQDIRALPTIQIFQRGELVNVIVGAVTKMKLRAALDAVV